MNINKSAIINDYTLVVFLFTFALVTVREQSEKERRVKKAQVYFVKL